MEAFPDTIQTACKVAVSSALLPSSSQDPEGQEQHQNGASHSQCSVDASKAGKGALGFASAWREESLQQTAMAPGKSC